MRHARFVIAGCIMLVALLGNLSNKSIENATYANSDAIAKLNINYHDWKTSDGTISSGDLKLLRPDSYLIRQYLSPDKTQEVDLAVIAGHRKQSIHTPGFCMVGGGWEITGRKPVTVNLPTGPLTVMQSFMAQSGHQLVALYFYTDGSYSTDNLIKFQAVELLKRIERRAPEGALVRVIVPMRGDPNPAVDLAHDFLLHAAPNILSALKSIQP
jgi:EpsI family protein